MQFKTFYNPKSAMDNLDLEDLVENNEDYFLSTDLNENQKKQIDFLLDTPLEKKAQLENLFIKSADLVNRTHNNYKLYPAQIDPVVMSYINPRLFITDSPGLGKTIEAGGVYAYYRLKQLQQNLNYGKVLVVSETIHVLGFQKEWENLGIRLLPLYNGNAMIKKQILKFIENPDNYDGVVINWSGIKTNEFVNLWLECHNLFKMGIFDETSCLCNPKSMIYRMADTIINKYQNGLERVVFLNGTPFEKDIYDYYYQFKILKPNLIPSKTWLEGRYVIKEGKSITLRQINPDGSRSLVTRNTGEIVDYKNQEELRKRLKYFMIGRTKSDFSKSGSIPKHSYILHMVSLSSTQIKKLKENKKMSLINSPETSSETDVLNRKSNAKFNELMNFIPRIIEDRPLIYAVNTKSQISIANELLNMGYRVGLINGHLNVEEKDKVVQEFESGLLDIIVFNIKKSLSIKTSERIIFYDIPTMPQQTLQISARIDRDNYDKSKVYDFFCYANSPEMLNMIELAYFREQNGNLFSGKTTDIYGQLVKQLVNIYSLEKIKEVSTKIETMYKENKEFKDISESVEDLLNIM